MDWQPDSEVERLLAPGAVGSTTGWRRLKDYLAGSFAAHLGAPAAPVWEPLYEDISPGWGFSFGLRSAAPVGGPLGWEWYGVVSHNGGRTEALVLLFSRDHRLTPADGSEYLRFVLGRSADGVWRWTGRGWEASELGEWDGYQSLAEVDRRMRTAGAATEPSAAPDCGCQS